MTDKSLVKVVDGNLTTIATGSGLFEGLAVDRSGNLYVSNTEDNTILKFERVNGVLSKTPSVFASGLKHPQELAFDKAGNLYEVDYAVNNINKFTYAHGHLSNQPSVYIDGAPDHANLQGDRRPGNIIFDSEGNLYVAISIGGILKFTRSASGLSKMPTPFATVSRARQMAFDINGNLFTANHLSENCVYKFPKLSSGLSGVPEIFATGNGLNAPSGVAFDSEGNLYVTNWGYDAGSTVLQYPNNNGVLSNVPTVFGPKFACPIEIWCVKSPAQPAPKVELPKQAPAPPTSPPPPTPATHPELFYD